MSRDGEGLTRSARSLIAAARDGDAPSAVDRARVRRALGVAIAASAGGASTSVAGAAGAKAAGASSAGGAAAGAAGGAAAGGLAGSAVGAGAASAGLAAKIAIAVVVLGVGTGSLVVWNGRSVSPPTRGFVAATSPVDVASPPAEVARLDAPATEPAEHVVPTDVAAPVPPEPVASAPAPVEAPAPALAPRRSRASAPSASPEPSIEDETLALRDAVAHGTPPEARLASVDAHAVRFPAGQLAPVRESARRRAVRDLCAEGASAVARYLAAHPTGPTAVLLHETCPASD